MTDPIADMLTRIRNAQGAKKEIVELPFSKMKQALANLLMKEGYLKDVEIKKAEETESKKLVLVLKYDEFGNKVIQGITRESKPGQRNYQGRKKLPKPFGGLGTAVISTTQGLLTDREARRRRLGGEIICLIW